jgi:hypothetical protein
MMQRWTKLSVGVLSLALLGLWPLSLRAKTKVGETVRVQIESPHPYANGAASSSGVWAYTLHHPGAAFLKLHFARFALGPGDAVRILDGQGHLVAEYMEQHNAKRTFWALSVDGDVLRIEMQADATGTDEGVTIDRYGYGLAELSAESICGSNQQEDVACYAGTPIEAASRAVGRMRFEEGGLLFSCTGFLISDQDDFLSNAHCISSQAAVESLEVRFNYELEGCGSGVLKAFETFTGDQLLLTNATLDVALMTLQGQPSATFGFLPLSSRAPESGEPLYLPQHSGGGVKQVSVNDCRVSTPRLDGSVPDSDFGHQCDTEPGSSGAPVLDAQHQVVGLHHWGGCMATGGENQAVLMRQILPLLPSSSMTLAVTAARLTFRPLPGRDSLTLRGQLSLPPVPDGLPFLSGPVTLTLADAEGPFYSAIVPPKALRQVPEGFLFKDPTGTIVNGLNVLRFQIQENNTLNVLVRARHLDLSGADRKKITVMFQIGAEAGEQTVAFRRWQHGFVFP